MGLAPGVRLGPYEVLALVGAGGMGEVYKARDTRLDRSVALKVLPPDLASDPQFRERFEREAKSISALTHPNICTLYDIGRLRISDASASQGRTDSQGDEVSFLVMEFLEGETLAARLQRGAVPIADALKIAIDIASALDRAHRQGIVHRDLKPGNVMLTKTGAKLLDFGLAKSGPSVAAGAISAMPTMSGPLTARGAILGTFQYMAPEQVEGEEADARTDIFAFGALLFELVTGQRAFQGKSHASLIGAIMKDHPPAVSQVQPVSPAALDHVVRTCLAKEREDRYQTAHDLLLQVKWIAEGGSGVTAPRADGTQRLRRERWFWAAAGAAGALVLAAGVLVATGVFDRRPGPQLVSFTVDIGGLQGAVPSVSPDGRWLTFLRPASAGRESLIWIRALGSSESTPLGGTDGANSVVWSPDSRAIAFFAQGRLKRVNIEGGVAQLICTLPVDQTGAGGSWNAEGDIVFSAARAIYRVSAGGGEPRELLKPDTTRFNGFYFPVFLPDGRHFVFFAHGVEPRTTGIYAGSLAGAPPTFITESRSMPAQAGGYLFLVREDNLVTIPFDTNARRVTGDPAPLATGVPVTPSTGRSAFAVSPTVLLFRTAARPDSELTWFDRDGKPLGTIGEPGPFVGPRLSPDGKLLAIGRQDPDSSQNNIWIIDLASGIMSRLTSEPTGAGDRFWSPNSQSVAFWTRRKGRVDLYHQAVGSREAEVLYESAEDLKWPDDWSRDGKYFLFHTGGTLYSLPMTGERKPQVVLQSPPGLDQAQFSPDGKFIAYGSNSSDQWEVYVTAFEGGRGRKQISAGGGGQVHWRADGRELFYLSPDGVVMSVPVTSPPGAAVLEFGPPKKLFQSPIAQPPMSSDSYDVTGDGKQFVFARPRGSQPETAPLSVTVNWVASLRK